jgi:6-pyruvoyl-tetrahydropterin synthase
MSTKKLNRRQVKWAKFLTEFDFKIAYQSKKKNDKADLLTKRLEDWSIDESNDRNKHMHQTIISVEKIDSRIVQKLNDTKKDVELFLFDKVKLINQEDSTCIEIRKILQENKKFYDEMLLKKIQINRKYFIF